MRELNFYIKESRAVYWSSVLVQLGMLRLVVQKANPNY